MKILFVDQFGELGGAQRCLLDLMPAVLDRGWKALCAAPGDGALLGLLQAQGAEVVEIAPGRYSSGYKNVADIARFGLAMPALARRLREIRIAHRPDLIYVNGPRVLPAVALARGRCPVLFHAHNHIGQAFIRWPLRRMLQSMDAGVVAVSQFVARGLPLQRMAVTPNGVADVPWTTKSGSLRRIGILGRIAPEKGHHVFLEAAKALHEQHPWLQFSVCGAPLFSSPGYDRMIQALARDLPVEFRGWRENAAEALSGLDLLVVPSLGADAAPRVVIEAFAAGVPVVAFPVGGIPELIEDGKTGFLTTTPTASALVTLIRRLLDDPEALRAISMRAREAWESRYTIERYQSAIIDAMARAAGERMPEQHRAPVLPQ